MGIILEALLVAWILTWFRMDEVIAKGISELLGREVSPAVYWLIFFLVAMAIVTKQEIFK